MGSLARVGVCLAVAAAVSSQAMGAPGRKPHDVMGGISSSQIVVRLKDSAFRNPAMLHRMNALGRDADPREALGQRFQNESRGWRVTRMRPAFSTEFAHPDRAAKLGLDRTFLIEVPPGSDTESMVEAFALLDEVEVATVDTVGGVAGDAPQLVPGDLSFGVQYAMHNGRCGGSSSGNVCDTNAECTSLTCSGQFVQGSAGTLDADMDVIEAWAIHTGDFGSVTLAILDSGLDSHPDLGTNSAPYPNGRIVEGRNTNSEVTPTLTRDDCGSNHGTHVSGIAAAIGDNGLGVAGMTWGAYVMPIRVTNSSCAGTITHLADGIRWAADHGADVGNMSLQYYGLTQEQANILRDTVSYARAAGMILIAATGNNDGGGIGVVAYPARAANIIGVGATNNRDIFCRTATCGWNANFGNEVDVCAPGDDIYSFSGGGGFQYLFGTSMASPHVAGLAALVKSYRTDLTNVDLESILVLSAEDRGPVGWDNQYGFGRVNALNALQMAETWRGVVIGSDPPSGAIDARKPTDRDGTNSYGWQYVDLTFSSRGGVQSTQDFAITAQGETASPPAIASVADLGQNRVRITFEQQATPITWTTLEHLPSGVQIQLGYLPGDVNGNRAMDAVDISALKTALEAPTITRGVWSTDIDRSEMLTAADLLEVIDLYNGAEGYAEWFGAELP